MDKPIETCADCPCPGDCQAESECLADVGVNE